MKIKLQDKRQVNKTTVSSVQLKRPFSLLPTKNDGMESSVQPQTSPHQSTLVGRARRMRTLQHKIGNARAEKLIHTPPVQRKINKTGLPDNLKSGIESLSGMSMDDVQVHYNSAKPAQLQALAYTQGTEIHVGPGQEKYLPHEAWHVVQQKQRRVKPTVQMKGNVNVNDDAGLEKEADVMGKKATLMTKFPKEKSWNIDSSKNKLNVIQRVLVPLGDPSLPGRALPSEALKGSVIDQDNAIITAVNTGSRGTGHSQVLVEHMTVGNYVINTLIDLITTGNGNVTIRIKQVNSIKLNLDKATSKTSWVRSRDDAVTLIMVAGNLQKNQEKFRYTFFGRSSRNAESLNCASFAERILVAAKIQASAGCKIAKPETLSNQEDSFSWD